MRATEPGADDRSANQAPEPMQALHEVVHALFLEICERTLLGYLLSRPHKPI